MSFFLQSKRNTDFPTTNNPSPFQYSLNPQKKKSLSYAPFNSTTKLSRGSIKKNQKQQKHSQYEDERVFLLDQNSIKIMAQQRMHSMFKSRSQRIMYTNNNVPGPGQYQLRMKFANHRNRVNNQSRSNFTNEKKVIIPSIPTDNLGYKTGTNETLQKVKPKQVGNPVPGSYEISKSFIQDRGLKWKMNATISRKEDDFTVPGPGTYNYKNNQQKGSTSCFASQTDRFNAKKIKKSQAPGPGDYNVSQIKPNRQFSQGNFNSKSSRFPIDKPSNPGPGSYIKNKNKSMTSFNQKGVENIKYKSDVYRKTIFTNPVNKNPGPGQYIARQGMTFQLQKALLRKHNISQFASSNREVFQVKNYDQPGPGAYEPTQIKGAQKGNIGYKKIEVVNLKDGQQFISPSPMKYSIDNHTISKKIQQNNQRLTLTDKKPFNSGSQRFQHYTNTKPQVSQRTHTFDTDNNNRSIDIDGLNNSNNFEGPKRVKKLIMTSVKVKVPFGTSTSKFQKEQELFATGPGSYQQKNKWLKQSYNIKGKLNGKQPRV